MVVKIQTELNSLVKSNLRFSGAVNIACVLGLHDALVVVKFSLNDSVSDRLRDNELCILGTVQHQLLGNVSKGDLAVGQRYCLDSGLDHVMMESGDQGVGVVSRELVVEPLENICIICLTYYILQTTQIQ